MKWLHLLVIAVASIHPSVQDLVTLAPSSEQNDEPTPSLEDVKMTPNIRSLQITSNIKYRYATTVVSSRVVNPGNSSGEAHFTVTLPESAFISQFLMEIKGKVYKAYVKEKEVAKAEYDQAVSTGQAAAHVALDARDSNQFTVSVNIEAQGKVTFNLTYEQLLNRNLGSYSNVINIDPQQIVEDMSVKVIIEEPSAIKDLEVPEIQTSNDVLPDKTKQNAIAKIEKKSSNLTEVTWAPTPEEQKKQKKSGVSGQFIVRYDVDRSDNPQQILVDEGYFVHFFAPENLPRLAKHVIFVLDFSGSMAGRKLEQLRDAMKHILSDLNSKDYFSIVVFQTYIEAWSPNKKYLSGRNMMSQWELDRLPPSANENTTLDKEFIVEVTPENVEAAKNYLTSYDDLGGTNIMGGLRTGLELVEVGSKQWENESNPPTPVMVFLTDGDPNIEESDPNVIVSKTKPLNKKDCPIFSLAFGYGADSKFLRKLSLSNFGFARDIYEASDASDQLKSFYQTISSPLLSNVTFSYLPGQVDNSTQTKNEFPAFFKGSELVVSGKVRPSISCPVDSVDVPIGELKGVTATGVQVFPIKVICPPGPVNRSSASHLEKTWAYLTIQQLLDKVDSLDESAEKNQTKKQALDLALQYSFVTPLTSLVVVKPNETESSVETKKLQPGAPGGFGGYHPLAISGGFGGASYAAGAPPSTPMLMSAAMPMAPPSRWSAGGMPQFISNHRSMPMVGMRAGSHHHDVDDDMSSMFSSSTAGDKYQPSPVVGESAPSDTIFKVELGEIQWLQSLLANSSETENIPVNIQGQQYILGLNETDQNFGACQANSEPGECHHFKYCPLSAFLQDDSKYLPYQCQITGSFLGVCCPQRII